MEDVLDEIVSTEDLKKFEIMYNKQLQGEAVDTNIQFQYAWCLVRSKYPVDIRKGIMLLEDLFNKTGETEKRDCLYYLAIGNARIKKYPEAMKYVKAFLQLEPSNEQVQRLELLIKKKMEREGLKGMAIAGGVIVGIASVLGLGIAMAKKG
ncbi:unnamed protein product [Trichogramma brassicae]|uniref:Mitochondrial fission 1 protein n=3 Tax=Trichogramma TaxID=7490 RepID=A0A6H5IHU2_9HYME|nr:unnamed protein product [Trichogramma brassicae]